MVAQDPRIVISTLMKLAGGSPSFASELNVDAFLEQVARGSAIRHRFLPCIQGHAQGRMSRDGVP